MSDYPSHRQTRLAQLRAIAEGRNEFAAAVVAMCEQHTEWSACQVLARINMLCDYLAGEGPARDPLVSVLLNAANEGPRLRATVREFRRDLLTTRTPYEIIVVSDGATDGSADNLGADVAVYPTPERLGCGRAKCFGVTKARGEVLIFGDGHHNVVRGHLADLIERAQREPCIVCPGLANIRYTPDWRPVLKDRKLWLANDSHLGSWPHPHYRQDRWDQMDETRCHVVAGVTCMTRETYAALGGWNRFEHPHGAQELGMSLRAWFADVPIVLLPSVVVGHEFRKLIHPGITGEGQKRNFWHAWHAVLTLDEMAEVRPMLTARANPARWRQGLMPSGWLQDHEDFQNLRRRPLTDAFRRLAGLAPKAKPVTLYSAIPYDAEGDLARAYNSIMETIPDGAWVALMDHDVLQLDDRWHAMIVGAITAHPEAGAFTCWCNRMRGPHQVHPQAPAGDDIAEHRAFAHSLPFDPGRPALTDLSGKILGGMMIVTNPAVWRQIGGFKPGAIRTDKGLGVDNEYFRRLAKVKLRVYRVDSLYVYHARYSHGCGEKGDLVGTPGDLRTGAGTGTLMSTAEEVRT